MQSQATLLDVRPFCRLFKALSDDTRLRMVAILAHGELCVCHVEEALGLPQSTASRQLGILKDAGIVAGRRQGTWIYYRLASQTDEACEKLLQVLVGSFSRQEQLRRDVERLVQIQGPQSCP